MKRWGGLGLVGPQGRGEGEVGLAFGPKQRREFFPSKYFLFLLSKQNSYFDLSGNSN
jgi:hypothetical protein